MKRCLAIALLAAACTAPAAGTDEAVIELIYASPYSPNHPFSLADRDWMAWVEAQREPAIRIRPIWSGALLSSDQSMIELRHGVADIGLVTPIYAKGGAHLLRYQTGFYSGISSQENQVALYRCLEQNSEEIEKELAGLKILAVQGGNLPVIVTRDRRIDSLADLDGLRIRAPTELLPVLEALGAEPVSMPMGDVYSALAKGIIDGVVAPTDTFRSLHFGEVAEFYARLAIPRGAYPARAMGAKRWQALPEDVRQLLERSIEVWERALVQRTTEALDAGEDYGLRMGMTGTTLSAPEQQRFLDVYSEYARHSAEELGRFGIDGVAVYELARASIQPDGSVACRRTT